MATEYTTTLPLCDCLFAMKLINDKFRCSLQACDRVLLNPMEYKTSDTKCHRCGVSGHSHKNCPLTHCVNGIPLTRFKIENGEKFYVHYIEPAKGGSIEDVLSFGNMYLIRDYVENEMNHLEYRRHFFSKKVAMNALEIINMIKDKKKSFIKGLDRKDSVDVIIISGLVNQFFDESVATKSNEDKLREFLRGFFSPENIERITSICRNISVIKEQNFGYPFELEDLREARDIVSDAYKIQEISAGVPLFEKKTIEDNPNMDRLALNLAVKRYCQQTLVHIKNFIRTPEGKALFSVHLIEIEKTIRTIF